MPSLHASQSFSGVTVKPVISPAWSCTEAKTAAEALEAENAALREENTALKTRLETLQAQLAGSAAQGAKRQR